MNKLSHDFVFALHLKLIKMGGFGFRLLLAVSCRLLIDPSDCNIARCL